MSSLPTPLVDDIADGKCLPFIGAGLSLNAEPVSGKNMPDFKGLAESLASAAGLSNSLTPPEVASAYEKKYGRVQLIESIRRTLCVEEIRPGVVHRHFADLPFDTVYTTNFDLLLEEAYALIQKPCRSLVGEYQIPFHGGPLTTNVVKMHGDLRHEEHIIVTSEDYDRFLKDYPVIATHLSAMLITRTPLFVGYSLSDTDFLHIREVVRSRLGRFERMAYVVEFDVPPDECERKLQDNLHLISLPTAGRSKTALLIDFLQQVRVALDAKGVTRLRSANPQVFEPLSKSAMEASIRLHTPIVLSGTSSICYVAIPFSPDADRVFHDVIRPVIEEMGLAARRAQDLVPANVQVNIGETVRAAIQQAQLCIAVVTDRNPNVLYELGTMRALEKQVVVLAKRGGDVPFDISVPVIAFDVDSLDGLRRSLTEALQRRLGEGRVKDADRLMDEGKLQSACTLYGVALEFGMRQLLALRSDRQGSGHLKGLLRELVDRQIVAPEDVEALNRCILYRNKAVHMVQEPARAEAEFMRQHVSGFFSKYLAWPYGQITEDDDVPF